MRQFLLIAALLPLAACGAANDESDGPDQASAGEIQALANAEAMLSSREDDSVEDPEEIAE